MNKLRAKRMTFPSASAALCVAEAIIIKIFIIMVKIVPATHVLISIVIVSLLVSVGKSGSS